MNVIIGLGNPGQTYARTRHNVGFLVVQLLAKRHAVSMGKRLVDPASGRMVGRYGEYREGPQTVRVVMPLTMMNASGQVLSALTCTPQELLLVCDDVHLPLGTLRLRSQGSAGGHHGLHSCLEAFGTERVARLRIGVRAGELPRELTDFVLSPFRRGERLLVRRAIERAAQACEVWMREGVVAAMNRYNVAPDRA